MIRLEEDLLAAQQALDRQGGASKAEGSSHDLLLLDEKGVCFPLLILSTDKSFKYRLIPILTKSLYSKFRN